MRTMSGDEARAFLADGARTGKLATASLEGDPHVTPLWFIVDGDDIVFITTATSIKGRHLHANPRAALAVEDDTFPYGFVTVRGPVVLEDEAPDRRAWAVRIAERYVPERAEEFGARNNAPGETLVRLHMARVFGQADLAL
jgi:PPOX class probable F420-dependent enzyme